MRALSFLSVQQAGRHPLNYHWCMYWNIPCFVLNDRVCFYGRRESGGRVKELTFLFSRYCLPVSYTRTYREADWILLARTGFYKALSDSLPS